MKNHLHELKLALADKNPGFSHCDSHQEIEIILFCSEILNKIRLKKAIEGVSDTTFIISGIYYILNELQSANTNAGVLNKRVDNFLRSARQNEWFIQYGMDECIAATRFDLLPWISTEKHIKSAMNFLAVTNLNQLLFSLLKKSIYEWVENSFLTPADILSALSLHNAIFLTHGVNLLDIKDKETILKRFLNFDLDYILDQDLDNNLLEKLWEMRWSMFRGVSEDILFRLDQIFEKRSESVKNFGFSWSPLLAARLTSNENIPNLEKKEARVLPYFQIEQERAVVSGIDEIRKRQVLPAASTPIRLGAALLCARILYAMGMQEPNRDTLMNLALVTQVLRASNNTASEDELKFALNVLKGAYKNWGWFSLYSMPEYLYMTFTIII